MCYISKTFQIILMSSFSLAKCFGLSFQDKILAMHLTLAHFQKEKREKVISLVNSKTSCHFFLCYLAAPTGLLQEDRIFPDFPTNLP